MSEQHHMVATGAHPGQPMENPKKFRLKGAMYRKPHQNKQWGDDDPEHHFNPFDTFFDLVFVGGAYAVGNMLKTDLSANGVLIFIASIMLLRWTWWSKVRRDSQFHFQSSFHTLMDVIHLVFVMVMVLNFEKTSILIDPSTNAALGVSVGLLGAHITDTIRSLEIGLVLKMPKHYWTINLFGHFVTIFSACASIGYCVNASSLEYLWIPWLVATEPKFGILSFLMCILPPRSGIPMNLTFMLHRDAEWAMLMLGEAIFSLLYIGSKEVKHDSDFYLVFIFGTLTTTSVCLHYFANYEYDVENHAMKIGRTRALTFSSARNWISVCLVAMGSAFKIMLYQLKNGTDPLDAKYANVFAYPFAIAILLSDLSKLSHQNGTTGAMGTYFRYIIRYSRKCNLAKYLCLLWLLKFSVVAVALSLPQLGLNAVQLAEAACGLSLAALFLVNIQNHANLDINLVPEQSGECCPNRSSKVVASDSTTGLVHPPTSSTPSKDQLLISTLV